MDTFTVDEGVEIVDSLTVAEVAEVVEVVELLTVEDGLAEVCP